MVGGYFHATETGMQRTLSGYNLFVRAKSIKLKEENPLLPQGELMKRVGEMWREMTHDEKLKWRADGEEGSRVPGSNTFIQQRSAAKPSSYQMFVKHMTVELHQRHPENKQAENMRRIGELWRELPAEERERYAIEAKEAYELQQQQAAAQAHAPGAMGIYSGSQGWSQVRNYPDPNRTLSAYNLFVRAMLQKLKSERPELEQGEHLKKVGELWGTMTPEEKAKWRVDGEHGSRVPGNNTYISQRSVAKPSSYQMFVKAMSAELHQKHPENKQAENMRKIGELWRNMPAEERERYAQEAQAAHEQQQLQAQQQAQAQAMSAHFSNPYNQAQWGALAGAAGTNGNTNNAPGVTRTLSAYHLFVRFTLQHLKTENPGLEQGECMKKVGELWRAMPEEEKAKWRADGEQGSRVPGNSTYVSQRSAAKPSSYQMFVKQMTAQLHQQHPENKQAENMRKIGELWRAMPAEERERYAQEAQAAHEQQQAQQQAINAFGSVYGHAFPNLGFGEGKRKRKKLGDGFLLPSTEGTTRTLSAYNLFVRATLQQLKQDNPGLEQGECMKKVGELWRVLPEEEKAKWRADGEQGSRVPGNSTYVSQRSAAKPSSYQMFVKQMTAQLHQQHPENKQAENMRKIGELWRAMPAEERERYAQEAQAAHEQQQAQQQAQVQALSAHYGNIYGNQPPLHFSSNGMRSDYLIDGTTRMVSAYNLFVRSMLQKLKATHPDLDQAEYMKKVGELWRDLPDEDKAKWRAEGEEGAKLPSSGYLSTRVAARPSSYQMFVKAMTVELHQRHPENKQAENMRKIGEMWREMTEEEKAKWRAEDDGAGGDAMSGTGKKKQRKVQAQEAMEAQHTQFLSPYAQQHPSTPGGFGLDYQASSSNLSAFTSQSNFLPAPPPAQPGGRFGYGR